MRYKIGLFFVILGIILLFYTLYTNSKFSGKTRSFSSYTLLSSSWEKYKVKFINKDGRVIDYSQNSITTSEGQSYAMLRSVWMDDKDTFDLVWKWTSENMDRPNDELFGWRWGKLDGGKFGFLSGGGENSASDGDSDIVLALIFAGRRWNEERYITDAKKILPDLWRINTASAAGKRYFIAGNWAQSPSELVLNLSYFSPYAWRIFATVDTKNDWESLIDPAYEVLEQSSQSQLDKGKGVGLPPDWVVIERRSGTLKASTIPNFTTNYSFDAMRTPFRIAIDYQWNKSEQAKKYLVTMCKELREEYTPDKKLVSSYSHDGVEVTNFENPSMYATSLGCFITIDPKIAKEIYEQKVINLYANDKSTFREDLPYYEQNWLWFGAALYNKALIPYK